MTPNTQEFEAIIYDVLLRARIVKDGDKFLFCLITIFTLRDGGE